MLRKGNCTENESVKMRICYISTGKFSHIDHYLEYFRQTGHDVHFVCLSPSPKRSVPTYNLGIGQKYSQTHGKWKYPLSMIRVRKLIRKIKPDIIHAHYATSGGMAALVSGFHPAIVTVHGSDLISRVKSPVWRPLLKRIFDYSDCINVVSRELAEIALSLGTREEKIEILTPGIDTEKFAFVERSDSERTSPLRMICTRRLEGIFDHYTILNALSILEEKKINFEMTFAGSGSLFGDLKQRAENHGLSDRINFSGRVPNSDLPEVLANHDIYLSASRWDGTSLSLLEAMASGLFPIVSNINANAAWIQDGFSGFLHRVGDADDLASCILRFFNHPEIRQKAIQHNRQKVCKMGDRNTNMKLLESAYMKLIAK